jgi:hypothetical protein
MRDLVAITSVSLAQLARRKLVLAALIVSLLFLVLFALICSAAGFEGPANMNKADVATAALFLTLPGAATLAVAFVFILGSSLLPDEIQAGRAAFWAALPVSRVSIFTGFSVSCLLAGAAVSALLFGGIVLITHIFFPFTETSVLEAAGSFALWLFVLWSSVTILSLVMNRMAAIIICFSLWGLAGFLGGLGQVATVMPEEGPGEVFKTVGLVSSLVYPADPCFRTMMHGLMPRGAMAQDFMAFSGVAAAPGGAVLAWALVWAAALCFLSMRKFRGLDLK